MSYGVIAELLRGWKVVVKYQPDVLMTDRFQELYIFAALNIITVLL